MTQFWRGSRKDEYLSYFSLLDAWAIDESGIYQRHNLQNYLCVSFEAIGQILAASQEMLDHKDGRRPVTWQVEQPSFFKKAAVLSMNTWKIRPFYRREAKEAAKLAGLHPDDDQIEETCLRAETAANARFALDLGLRFLLGWSITGTNEKIYTVENQPVYPSEHFMIELCERLVDAQVCTQGLALIFEALTYMSNPEMAGCRDSATGDSCDPFLL